MGNFGFHEYAYPHVPAMDYYHTVCRHSSVRHILNPSPPHLQCILRPSITALGVNKPPSISAMSTLPPYQNDSNPITSLKITTMTHSTISYCILVGIPPAGLPGLALVGIDIEILSNHVLDYDF
ncbi:hypothetical protein BDZ91DRAFT_714979 [Kalaharituber pfeilii]|nr:hypothetical protein BDZ91DRAFT_714979 [Kalaharituber pfeilii]